MVKAQSATPGGLVETLARQLHWTGPPQGCASAVEEWVNYTEVMLWYLGCPRGIGNPCPSGRLLLMCHLFSGLLLTVLCAERLKYASVQVEKYIASPQHR